MTLRGKKAFGPAGMLRAFSAGWRGSLGGAARGAVEGAGSLWRVESLGVTDFGGGRANDGDSDPAGQNDASWRDDARGGMMCAEG
jgi:hypothetical protein